MVGGIKRNKQLGQQTPGFNQPPKTLLKVSYIMLAGLLVGGGLLYVTNKSYRNTLTSRVQSIARALDGGRVKTLKLPDDGETSMHYRFMKSKLAGIKAANKDIRFVYLMGRQGTPDDGFIYFMADSEPTNSDDYSPHGEKYPEASKALWAVFDNGKPMIEGPVSDSYGTWLSALAPVYSEKTGQLVAVAGLDVPASSYYWLLIAAGGGPVVVAALASGLVWVLDGFRRRRQENDHFQAEMVSIASHELRTPLTGLRWTQETMLDEKLSKTQRDMVEAMYESTLRLQESIEDVLQLANIGAGKAQLLQVSDTDIKMLLTGIFKTQQLAAKTRGIKLKWIGDWPQAVVLPVDPTRIKRVFNNLISNAIKYSPDAGRHIFSVADHGIGIPQSEQAEVFGGFYRASNAVSSEVNGTGMGLYVSRAIVGQHGGRIWFTSQEGKGTTVYVELLSSLPESAKQRDEHHKPIAKHVDRQSKRQPEE
jgi:signal transduction histidine kinase